MPWPWKKENTSSFQNWLFYWMSFTCLLRVLVAHNLCSSQQLCISHSNPPPPTQLRDARAKQRFHLVFACFPGSQGMHFFHGFAKSWAGVWQGFHLWQMNCAWCLEGGEVHSEFFTHKVGFHCISLTVKVNVLGIPQLGGRGGGSNDWCITMKCIFLMLSIIIMGQSTLEKQKTHKLDRNLPITTQQTWPFDLV